MDSFTSSTAGPSTSFNIRHAQESDPDDNNYYSSDNSIKSIRDPFKKPLKKTEKYKNEKGNKSTFNFKEPKSYLIKEGLFTWELLNIDYSKPRQVVFKCTMPNCNYINYQQASRVQIGSNGTTHYLNKHRFIAVNKEAEKTLIKSKY